MNNPLIGGAPQTGGPMDNIQNLMQQFNQFRQSFSGDPRQQVQQLLNSGRVSQQDYNRAYEMASQLQKIMGPKP